MKRRDPGNNTVHVEITELSAPLQDREELEYTSPSEEVPCKARATSRFDTPEFTAIFESAKRHVMIFKGVGTVFRRQGYEMDLKCIATAKAEHCVEAMCGQSTERGHRKAKQSHGATKPDRQRGVDVLVNMPPM